MALNELDQLKAQADLMGITYKANIGAATLRERIQAKLDDKPDPEDEQEEASTESKAPAKKEMTKAELEQKIRDKQAKEQMKLVRLRVTCLNPLKREVKGEIITVANRYVGTVRKFVPFGEATDNGYHVPHIIYEELKSRRYNSVTSKKGERGQILPIQRLVPEFALEVLPQLTKEELEKLAASQAAAAGA